MLTRVFSLFSKPKKIVIIAREACKLTVDEWRSDPALTKVAYSILNHKDFKSMIDVLKNTGPHTFMMPSISIEERAIWQARRMMRRGVRTGCKHRANWAAAEG